MFKKFGEIKTTVRELSAFTSIEVGEKFNVHLTQNLALPEQISITYADNLTDKISTIVKDSALTIVDENLFNWVRKLDVAPEITINIHSIKKFIFTGSANVDCLDTLKIGHINVSLQGVGTIYLKLKCGYFTGVAQNPSTLTVEGSGTILAWTAEDGHQFDFSKFECLDAYIYHYTLRDCYVNSSKILQGNLWSRGNLFYTQEPQIKLEKKEYGKGKVLKQ